jgi:hypothetical protein
MKKSALICLALSIFLTAPLAAQQAEREAKIKRMVPYARMLRESPGMTLTDYNRAVRELARKALREDGGTYTPPAPTYTVPCYAPPPRHTTPSYASPSYTPPVYTPPPPTSGGQARATIGSPATRIGGGRTQPGTQRSMGRT